MARGEEDTASVFVLALLTTLLVPWTLMKLNTLRKPDELGSWRALGFADDSTLISQIIARRPHWVNRWLTGNEFYIICVLLSLLLLESYVSSPAAVQAPFDPHEMLGVSSGASMLEIKAAYRKLASALHPDKNPDPEAHARFVLVAKAHAILTNPNDRAHYERAQGMRGDIGFALPAFAYEWYVVIPILVIIFVAPIQAAMRAKRKGDWAIYTERRTQSLYSAAVHDAGGMPPPRPVLLLTLCRSVLPELITLVPPKDKVQSIARRLEDDGQTIMPAFQPRDFEPVGTGDYVDRVNVVWTLISAHLTRLEIDVPEARRVLDMLLAKLPPVLDAIRRSLALSTRSGMRCGLSALAEAIELEACLAQAVPFLKHPRLAFLLEDKRRNTSGHSPSCGAASLLQLPRVDITAAATLAASHDVSLAILDTVNPDAGDSLGIDVGLKASEEDFAALAEAVALEGAFINDPPQQRKMRKRLKGKAIDWPDDGDGSKAARTRMAKDGVGCAPTSVGGVLEVVTLDQTSRASLLKRAAVNSSAEMELFCAIFPRATLTFVRAYVAGEEDEDFIFPNDTTTVELRLALSHRRNSRCAAYAPRLPFETTEEWFVGLESATGARRFHSVVKVPMGAALQRGEEGGVYTVKLTLDASLEPGIMQLRARACCLSYVGADVSVPVELRVMRPKKTG